ncbi:polyphosphate glucokinase [Lutibacter agarilyticus]|uniref:Polyphosphate glucokinase n=1 Tax=Lutibacter agarilyticus TaxID=1109740 RepID=A0A238XKX0_9FLAO|nr:ROK family protein [Lutibacter agarilyticus]SNR59332.1 polyphosphate glucokinase [Lutibacter agarilyticus]
MEVLGIDVGGTGIKGAIVDTSTGKLTTERYRIPTPKPATPEAVSKVIQKMVKHFNWTGLVGCGFPTPLQHGTCLSGGNLHEDWKGTNVKELFQQKTGNQYSIVNDADAAGLAEIGFGAGVDKEGVVVVITLGTGIGSAVFLDGKLLPNTEFGHVLHKNGEIFEKYAADSARKREQLSRKKWGDRLHEYFEHIELLLSPDLFIVGGGASKKLDKFEARININTPIVAAEAENEAGIIGAALAAKFHIK